MPVGKDGRFTQPVDDYAGMQVFDANLHIIDDLKAGSGVGDPRHAAAAPRDLRPLLPALLALPRAPDLQGRLVVVRRGDGVQGADARAQPGDQLGARAHPRRFRSASGWRTPATGRSPATGSGAHPCRCGRATTRPTRGSTSTARSRRSSATSAGCRVDQEGNPDLHRPFVDDLTRPNPDDPTGRSTMRRVTDVLDVWFDSGSMSFAQNHVPVRERGLVPAPLPGGLHRRVRRADPRLVLHDAHPGHRRLRPRRVPELHQPRHRARLRRQQDVEVAAQLPRRPRGLRPRRRGRDALVPDGLADPARRQPRSSPSRASATPCAA